MILGEEKSMRPLSQDLRQRIITARERGEGTGEVCKRFGVSRKSVERFWKEHGRTGQCLPKQIGGYRRSRLAPHDRQLQRWIETQPDLSLAELRQRCLARLDVAIGTTALWHRLRRLGLTFKKNDARRRTRPARR
jgi:transposase